ncbi:MAG: hypothetical protein KKI08_07875 [Armatimonadetes bacterium]|nr:hypothetical protein [Armatimonadota bacterium]
MAKHGPGGLTVRTLTSLALLASAVVAAQAGSVLVCYEAAPRDSINVDIYVQRLGLDGQIGWGGDDSKGRPVANSADVEMAPVACSDGAGGAIVVYQYVFTAGENRGDADIVAQRMDADGNLLWNGGAKPVPIAGSGHAETHPVVLSDGHGGAFVVYESQGEAGDTDLLAQRVDATGNVLWNGGAKPVAVAASPGRERGAVIVPDGQGGIIVVFEWEGENGNTDIMAQRLSATGQALWNNGEQAANVADTADPERHPCAISDGQGGAIIAFEREYVAGEHKGDVDVMAQRLSGSGTLVWDRARDVSTAPGLERNPVVVSDGVGGAIVACGYEAVEGEDAGDTDILAQRLSPSGDMMWNEGKRSAMVSSSKRLERAPRALPTSDGGAVFVVEAEVREGERVGDVDLVAQRLSAQGEMRWEKGERSAVVSNSKWIESGAVIVPDGMDGAVVIFTMTGPKGKFEGDQDVDAMRVSGEGAMLWNEGKKPVDVAGGEALERNPCAVAVAQ